jgi:hypothetical protein
LSAAERAAYVLRQAFDCSYRQIADILQMEEANTRQLVSRARKHIADGRRIPASSEEQRRFWRLLSPPPKREIWLLWKVSSQKMLSLVRMAVVLYARQPGLRFLGASALRSSLLLSLHISGRA